MPTGLPPGRYTQLQRRKPEVAASEDSSGGTACPSLETKPDPAPVAIMSRPPGTLDAARCFLRVPWHPPTPRRSLLLPPNTPLPHSRQSRRAAATTDLSLRARAAATQPTAVAVDSNPRPAASATACPSAERQSVLTMAARQKRPPPLHTPLHPHRSDMYVYARIRVNMCTRIRRHVFV